MLGNQKIKFFEKQLKKVQTWNYKRKINKLLQLFIVIIISGITFLV